MFCVLLLAACFTLSTAEYWNSQRHPRFQPYSYEPVNKADKDGYIHTFVEGQPTNTCNESVVKGSPEGSKTSPTKTKFYGPYLSKIKYLMISPLTTDGLMNYNGLVKVWKGGVGSYVAVLHFKTDRPNTFFNFSVKMCW